MTERERQHKNIFDDDDLDEAVSAADDTGLVAGRQQIEEETLFPEEPEEPEERKPGP